MACNSESAPAVSLSKEQSLGIKGIALLMMLVHHAYSFPEWYNIPFTENLVPVGMFANYCVPIFALLSGWIYGLSNKRGLLYSCKKILSFLVSYWVMFIVIASFAIIFAGWRPALWEIRAELFPLRPTGLMCFCWYVSYYSLIMLLLPFVKKCESIFRFRMAALFVSLAAISLLYCQISTSKVLFFKSSALLITPIIGYYLATSQSTYGFIGKITRLGNRSILFCCLSISVIAVAMFCLFSPYSTMLSTNLISRLQPLSIHYNDYLALEYNITGCLCFLSLYLFVHTSAYRAVSGFLSLIGKYSMNMWFIHCIFFSDITKSFFQPFITWAYPSLLVIPCMLVICLLLAIVINWFQNYLFSLLSAAKCKFCA